MCLLHAINDNEMMKKILDFVKITFILMEILNEITCNLNWIQILKLNSNIFKVEFKFNLNLIKSKFNWINFFKNGMQIDAQAIENMFITFIIHDYDVEKEKNNFAKTQI